MAFDSRLRTYLVVVALLFGAASTARAQPQSGNGVLINNAAMYLTPDPTRTPLATLPAGTPVRVLAKEGDWYRVVFRDRYLGDRTGYVLAANVRIEPAAPPSAAPRPAVPGQVAPAPAPREPVIIAATPMKVQRDRGYLWLSGTHQLKSTAFTAATTFAQNGGTGTITTIYDGVHPSAVDFAIGGRVWRELSIGIAATWAAQLTDAAVSALVPSPVQPGNLRSVSGTATSIRHEEVGIHFDASWAAPAHGRYQAVIFAGPTLFRVKQGLVTGVTVNETPPFTTATFANAATVQTTRVRLGGNAGVEASVRLWKELGVGAMVRYSRATVPFSPAAGTDVSLKVGGTQVGAGLHFRF